MTSRDKINLIRQIVDIGKDTKSFEFTNEEIEVLCDCIDTFIDEQEKDMKKYVHTEYKRIVENLRDRLGSAL